MRTSFMLIPILMLIAIGCSDNQTPQDTIDQKQQTPIPAAEETFNFRNTRWRMTRHEVKEVERSRLIVEHADAIVYDGSVYGLDCQIGYTFGDSGLCMCMCNITEDHSNPNLYFSDYSKLLVLLKEKYGTPLKESTDWDDTYFRDNPEDWGRALSLGHVTLETFFTTTDSTSISVTLMGDNQKIGFMLTYSNVPLLRPHLLKLKERIKRDEL